MRILTRKIWRAFPELDQFDDEACQRYIRQIISYENMWKAVALISTGVMLAFAVWYFGVQWVKGFYFGMPNAGPSSISSDMSTAFIVLSLTGHIWFPIIVLYVIRDRWYRFCIRKIVVGTSCGACGYSLIGLALIEDAPDPAVICPECGHRVVLGEMGITQADIDPTMLAKD